MNANQFQLPARLYREDGGIRRVGVEIEMSDIQLRNIVELISECFGGDCIEISPYEFEVRDTVWGTFKAELDFEILQRYGREHFAEGKEVGDIKQLANETLSTLAQTFIPCELVTPPIPIDALHKLEIINHKLRQDGAKGTYDGLITAFGVHLNLELPDLQVVTILRYIQAFICLYDWLKHSEEIALSRRLSSFINPFPEEYEQKVLNPDYQPDLKSLIDDYLLSNATRNRALDLLPLFGYFDEARVMSATGGQKLRARPTLHYRLPNSDIDNPDWGLWHCWNDWQQVEILANHPERLSEVSHAWREHHRLFNLNITPWREKVIPWLTNLSLE